MEIVKTDDIVTDLSKKLNNYGLKYDKLILEMIVKSIDSLFKEYLLQGKSVEIEDIGTVYPVFRKANTGSKSIVPTIKLAVDIDESLKLNMLLKVTSDPEFSEKLKLDKDTIEMVRKYLSERF